MLLWIYKPVLRDMGVSFIQPLAINTPPTNFYHWLLQSLCLSDCPYPNLTFYPTTTLYHLPIYILLFLIYIILPSECERLHRWSAVLLPFPVSAVLLLLLVSAVLLPLLVPAGTLPLLCRYLSLPLRCRYLFLPLRCCYLFLPICCLWSDVQQSFVGFLRLCSKHSSFSLSLS